MKVDHSKKIIELKDLTFSYNEECAVENINLEVHQGDYLGVIGPNGGGKTTILKLMLGLLKPQKGEVLFDGKPLNSFHPLSKVGYISQHVSHLDDNFPMTVREIVATGRYSKRGLFHFLSNRDTQKIRTALEHVEMWEFRNRLIGDLSGGQRQRVFIARVLAQEPEIIILDEPTVGVDVKTQKQFYCLMQKLNQELDLTLILASHELDIVAHEATEIAYINKSLVYYGIPKEFVKSQYFEQLTGKGAHTHD